MSRSAWRIVKATQASEAFTGEGARRHGGRWNSRGKSVIYTAGSISLATLEMLVHLDPQQPLEHYVLFEVSFDDEMVAAIDPAALPRNWRESPAPLENQAIGDEWLDARHSSVLRVPSAIVPEESNYLLNPSHADFTRITVSPEQPVRFDPRLIIR